MNNTPKSLRLQIAIFGRTNVGKSSFLNMIANQDVAITSEVPGTTTDVVEKSMELLPIGPVTFLDTAGVDDKSELSVKRINRTMKILDRADIAVLVVENEERTEFEDKLIELFRKSNIPFIIAKNKIDLVKDNSSSLYSEFEKQIMECSSNDTETRDNYVNKFKELLQILVPESYFKSQALIGDLMPKGGTAVLIIPIDKEAPKGRIILPQVQTIRDILDHDSISLMIKETEYSETLNLLKKKPDIVICDSQVVDFMVYNTPKDVLCTTFSILFSRFKGDLIEEIRGAAAIKNLKPGDKVLIAEACSHHPNEDDIGRVKIPKWLREYLGYDIEIDVISGRDYPDNIDDFKVIIHCGACMLTRNEKMERIKKSKRTGVPITNYGIAISLVKGVLERVLEPFPVEFEEFKELTV